jgi:D-arabinose 5-phosphate isomerase GutQ
MNHIHEGDLPDGLDLGPVVAIDTETMGLIPHRDRLCLVQLSAGDGDAHLVRIGRDQTRAPNLEALLADPARLKLFHFGRFDIAVMAHRFGVLARPVWCTKIASKLVRTYTDRHGLKNLCSELLGVDLSKQQQSSDWGADDAVAGAGRIRRVGRALPACAARRALGTAGARGAHGHRRGLFRLPARPRGARPRGLARNGHILALSMAERIDSDRADPAEKAEADIVAIGRARSAIEAEALAAYAQTLDAPFAQAVETILAAPGRVVVSGIGKSGHVGRKIAATLASTGTPAFFVHPSEASHGDLGMITQGDVALVISNSGESQELHDVIGHTRRFAIPLIGVASRPRSALIEASDVGLILPRRERPARWASRRPPRRR